MNSKQDIDVRDLFRLETKLELVLLAFQSKSIRPLLVQYIHSGSIDRNAFQQQFEYFLNQLEISESFKILLSKERLSKDAIKDYAISLLQAKDELFCLLSQRLPLVNRITSLKKKINKGSVGKYIETIQCANNKIDIPATCEMMINRLKLSGAEKALLKLTLDRNSICTDELIQPDLNCSEVFQIAVICGEIPILNTLWSHEEYFPQIKSELLDNDRATVLHLAVLSGNVEAVDWLLENGFAVHAGNQNGDTALHLAASIGNRCLLEKLISKGADCSARNTDKKTPLHKAAEGNHPDIVLLLVGKGVDIEAQNDAGNTPLLCAVEKGNLHIVELLLDHGASIYAQNAKANSCLHRAAFHGHAQIVELILRRGAENVESKDSDERTPLHIAAERGHDKVVEIFLRSKVDVNSRNRFNQTPLHVAAWKGHSRVTELLLKGGAVCKANDSKNRTALHEAAWNGHDAVVKLLLVNSDVNSVDLNNDTALHLAEKFKKTSIVELLTNSGAVE